MLFLHRNSFESCLDFVQSLGIDFALILAIGLSNHIATLIGSRTTFSKVLICCLNFCSCIDFDFDFDCIPDASEPANQPL